MTISRSRERAPESLTVLQVAARLGVSAGTVRRLIARSELPAWRTPGGHLRVPASAVIDHARGAEARGFEPPGPLAGHGPTG